MTTIEFNIPRPVRIGVSWRFWRSEIEFQKQRIVALSNGQPEPSYTRPENDQLVGSAQLVKELGYTTRTLMRRVKALYGDVVSAANVG